MPLDPDRLRLTMGYSALAGGVFYALYTLSTRILAGQPVHRQEVILAFANVTIGIIGGALAGFFLGPLLMEAIPAAALKDPHAVGFGIGAGAWEVAPFAFRAIKGWAKRKGEGVSR